MLKKTYVVIITLALFLFSLIMPLISPHQTFAQDGEDQNPDTDSGLISVTLFINQLVCNNAQEDRWISIDGDGDEIYLIYKLNVYDEDGELQEVGLNAWGIRRLQRNDIVSNSAFRTISITVPANSVVDVEILLMESDSYDEALEVIENIQEEAGEEGARLLAPSVVGETTSYSELFDLVTGVEFFRFLSDEDELGRIDVRFNQETLSELASRGVSYQDTKYLENSGFNNTWEYRIKFALVAQWLAEQDSDAA